MAKWLNRIFAYFPFHVVSDASYGVVPFQQPTADKPAQFLLVKHLEGHWGFPKGHPEGKETPEQTARRELKEETGIDAAQLWPKPQWVERYYFWRPGRMIRKKVFFMAAEVADTTARPQEEEIATVAWFDFPTALATLTYPNGQKILRQAEEFLKKHHYQPPAP
jgi:8-oxo-dGTP pyrophosphatase MutT (NUDIX family)